MSSSSTTEGGHSLPDHSAAAVKPTELWTVRSEIRRRTVAEPVEAAHHVMALEAEVLALRADADRLAAGLRARGIIPGRNPDGVNDDAEKALTLLDDYRAENERLAERYAAVRNAYGLEAQERGRLQGENERQLIELRHRDDVLFAVGRALADEEFDNVKRLLLDYEAHVGLAPASDENNLTTNEDDR